MVDYDYFYLKNTHSYDKSIACVKYLSEEFFSYCKDCIYRFIAENYYIKSDYFLLHKEAFDEQSLRSEMIKNFSNYKKQLFPNIEVSIHVKNGYFYLLFSNLQMYNLSEAVADTKVIYMQSVIPPDVDELYKDFYLTHIFFDTARIDFSDFSVQEYRPDLESRSKNQIKIILQEQMLNKNQQISYSDILKINGAVAVHENVSLVEKIKSALSKADFMSKNSFK